MGEVDPAYVAFLEESVVIRLNDPPDAVEVTMQKRDLKERQSGTCDIQGYALPFFTFFSSLKNKTSPFRFGFLRRCKQQQQ